MISVICFSFTFSFEEIFFKTYSKVFPYYFCFLFSDAIPYFDFILDPTSFGKSVENMFHVSFLIKEGRAKMIVQDDRDDGLPYIRPMKEGKPGAGNNTLIRFHEKEKYF